MIERSHLGGQCIEHADLMSQDGRCLLSAILSGPSERVCQPADVSNVLLTMFQLGRAPQARPAMPAPMTMTRRLGEPARMNHDTRRRSGPA